VLLGRDLLLKESLDYRYFHVCNWFFDLSNHDLKNIFKIFIKILKNLPKQLIPNRMRIIYEMDNYAGNKLYGNINLTYPDSVGEVCGAVERLKEKVKLRRLTGCRVSLDFVFSTKKPLRYYEAVAISVSEKRELLKRGCGVRKYLGLFIAVYSDYFYFKKLPKEDFMVINNLIRFIKEKFNAKIVEYDTKYVEMKNKINQDGFIIKEFHNAK